MKVIKLNKKFKRFSEGYTHAMRWDSWGIDKSIGSYEKYLSSVHGFHSYRPGYPWYSEFGTRDRKTGYKPYYIYVSREHLITAALLAV
jgi:hypothetical protein